MKTNLTVFLCGTYTDLAEERKQILSALQKLQLQHDSMEFFGARPNQAIETCLEEVRQSDLLIVVVGHRYGTLTPNNDLSFSEAEYREGHRLGKPCLVYMRSDNAPVTAKLMERIPENLHRLERWKSTLRERHTVAEFLDSNDLALSVSADLSRMIQALQEAQEDETPSHTGMHDLFITPPIPRGFVGREAELESLNQGIESPNEVLVWIGGIPGIGKTYLAAKLYEMLLETGQRKPIWFECKGEVVRVDYMLEALASLSEDEELVDFVQDKAHAPNTRFRVVLKHFLDPNKAVLFIDDYDELDPEEHEKLLEFAQIAANSANNAKLILVGRTRPSLLDDADVLRKSVSLEPDGLAPEYVRDLVGLADLTTEQAQQVWIKCASGVPLALLVFAAAVRTRALEDLLMLPVWDIPGAKAKWLDIIMTDMPEDELKCLKVLSIYPAPISSRALAAIYRSEGAAVKDLESLLNKSLLRHQPGTDYWSFRHETIREYVASELVSSEEQNSFEEAGARHFLRYALETIHTPVDLQGEVVNILHALQWFVPQQATKTWTTLKNKLEIEERDALRLTFRLGQLSLRTRENKLAISLVTEVSDTASQMGDKYLTAQALFQLAEIVGLRHHGKEQAIHLAQRVVDLSREIQPVPSDLLGSAYYFLALQFIRQGDQSSAEICLVKGIEAAIPATETTTRARLVGRLAYLYQKRGDFDNLRILYKSERPILTGVRLAELEIGIVPGLIEAGDLEEAFSCIEEARGIFRGHDNLGGVAYTYRLEAMWHWHQGETDRAGRCYQEEVTLRRQAVAIRKEEQWELLQALRHQFRFYLNTNQLKSAENLLDQYIQESAEYGRDHHLADMYGQLVNVALFQHDFRKASRLLNQANRIYLDLGNLGGQAWIKKCLGDIAVAEGRFGDALARYNEGLALRLKADEPVRTASDYEYVASFASKVLNDNSQAIHYLEQALLQYEKFSKEKTELIRQELQALI